MSNIILRVGIPKPNGSYLKAAKAHKMPVMISAAAFWKKHKSRFITPGDGLIGADIFLDSAGFTAMAHYGGYPWTIAQYIDLVSKGTWSHWSAMDLCCEPEISTDPNEIRRRIKQTTINLIECRKQAANEGLSMPVPIVQGFAVDQYSESADQIGEVLGGQWPELIGVGSVCRRPVGQIIKIVDHLDRVLPQGVQFHLFGVKSGSLAILRSHPRIHSVDSMAWNFSHRMKCRQAQISCTVQRGIVEMERWYQAQLQIVTDQNNTGQLSLFGGA